MTMLTIFTRAAAVHSSRLHALHAFKPKRDPTADPYDTGSGIVVTSSNRRYRMPP